MLEGARFAVRPGQRYGIRLSVVTENGIHGTPKAWDLIKPPALASTAQAARVESNRQTAPAGVAAPAAGRRTRNNWEPQLRIGPASSGYGVSSEPRKKARRLSNESHIVLKMYSDRYLQELEAQNAAQLARKQQREQATQGTGG